MAEPEPCPSVLPWDGHPQGWVPCDLDTPHYRHSFSWLDEDDEWHLIQWTDQLLALMAAAKGGALPQKRGGPIPGEGGL